MADLRIGQFFKVNTENEVDLRRQPNTNPKTEDGKDNVILAIPSSAYLVLESIEVPTHDGHQWYNVTFGEEVGWVESDLLQETTPPDIDGGAITTYNFQFVGQMYSISDENLTNAVGQYLFVQHKLKQILQDDIARHEYLLHKVYEGQASEGEIAEFRYLKRRLRTVAERVSLWLEAMKSVKNN